MENQEEPWGVRLRRKRRADPELAWTAEDEKKWQAEFPGDPLPDFRKAQPEVVEATFNFDPELIPVLDDENAPYANDPGELAVNSLDILDAYAKWCGKMTPKVGNKREGIMISCPDPGHKDTHPSVWVNLDKQTFFCGRDQFGGDKFDIAAWHFNFDVPGYKTDGTFPNLKRRMAEDLGYVTIKGADGKSHSVLPTEDPEDDPEPSGPGGGTPPPAEAKDTESTPPADPVSEGTGDNYTTPPEAEEPPVTPSLRVVSDDEPDSPATYVPENCREHDVLVERGQRIDWKSIVTPNTFLDEWMHSTAEEDDLAHEYYFWLGLQAIGCATGANIVLNDIRPVKGNLFVCLYGASGSGKSNSTRPYYKLLEDALPFVKDDHNPATGTKVIHDVGSAEALLQQFQYPIIDLSSTKTIDYAPVRGLVHIEELASFAQRAARPGSAMKTQLIQLYDAYDNDVAYTSISRGEIRAKKPFAQVLTTTQPKAIRDYLSRADAESGFMNRWVFANGKRRVQRRSYGSRNLDIDTAVSFLKGIYSFSITERRYDLQHDALELWDHFFQKEIVDLLDNSEEAMISRIDLMLKKLIVLFTVNERLSAPSVEIVQKVIALFPYLKSTYGMFSSDLARNELDDTENKILELVAAAGEKGYMKGRLVSDCRPTSRTIVERAIRTLEALDQIKVQAFKSKNGRETARLVAVK